MSEFTKRDVLKVVEQMPEDSSVHDILYEIYVRSQIDEGLKDLDEGRVLTTEEVRRSVVEWLQSSGH